MFTITKSPIDYRITDSSYVLARQHLLKNNKDPYYTSGDLEGYLRDYSPRQGTPRLPREAYVGVFDGTTNYANMPGRVTSGTVPAITVTFWVKYTSTADVRFVNERYGSVLGWSVFQSSGSPGLVHFLSSSDGSTVTARYSAGVGLNDGEWHHIAVTGDSALGVGGIKFYIDGVLTAANTVTAGALNVFDSTQVLTIGAELSTAPSTYSLRLPGSLSDVRIYSTAKTADEIAAIYAGDQLNPDTTGLLAAYALEEESGTLLYDWSGNGNDLTVAGTMTNFWDTDADKTWSYVDSRGHSPVGPNLLTYSEDISNGAWVANSITKDGTQKIIESATTARHYIYQNASFTNGQTYTVSFEIKAAERSTLEVFVSAVNAVAAAFDASTGAVVTDTIGGVASNGTELMWSVGDGWYRCSYSFTAWSTATGGVRLHIKGDTTADYYLGDGVSGILIRNAQLQTGTEATTYSKTTATANPAVAIKPKQIGQSATYTGRTTYPGLSYVSTLQGDGSTVYVDCGATDGLVDNVKLWFYTGTAITSTSSARTIFSYNKLSTQQECILGSWTASATNEVISLGNGANRTCVSDITIAIGWHSIELSWNGSHYDIILDGVQQAVNFGTSPAHVQQFSMSDLRMFTRADLIWYSNNQIANFQFTTADGTTYTIVPERTGDRIWKMGTDGSAVLVDTAIAGTLTNVHQSAALPVEDWHLKHGGHVGTNLLTYSEQFDNGAWVTVNLRPSITPNYAIAPDGSMTAYRFVNTNENVFKGICQDISVTSGASYTFSLWVKATSTAGQKLRIWVDGSGTTIQYEVIATTEWVRYVLTGVVSDTSARVEISSPNPVSDSDVLIWGAQFVQGTEALPYTPTTASSATDVHVPASYNNVAPDGTIPYYAPGVLMETRKLAPRGGVDSVFANTINLESTYTFGNERASIDPIDTKRKVVLEPIGERDFVAYKEAIPLTGSFVEENLTLNHQYTRGEDYAVVGPELTFSRASGATMFNSSGTLVWAPENLVTYSEDFSNAAWSKGSGVTVESGFTSPNGVPAYRVNTASFVGETIRQTFTTLDGVGNYTFKCKIKGEGSNIGKTCSVTLSRNLGTSVGATSAVTLTDDWQDVTLNLTTLADTDGLKVFTYFSVAHATSYIISEPQLYRSPNASSTYIPTTSAAVYGMRTNSHVYEGGAWVNKGLLVEGQATNLVVYSEDLADASWTKTNTTVTSNSATAPDGTATADLVIASASTSLHQVTYPQVSITNGVTYSGSFFVKAAGYRYLQLAGNAAVMSGRYANFDLLTGTRTDGSLNIGEITNVGGGWYRITVALTANSTGLGHIAAIIIDSPTAARAATFLGDSVSGFLIWGAQLETGSFPTSYIPTTSAAVTRSADVATIGGTDFSGFYNQSEGTVVGEATSIPGSENAGFNSVVSFSAGAFERMGFFRSTTSNVYLRYVAQDIGGANVFGPANVSSTSAQRVSGALAYAQDDFAFYAGDGNSATDSSGVVATSINNFSVGCKAGASQYFNGHIKYIKYYSTRKPNAFLKGITS